MSALSRPRPGADGPAGPPLIVALMGIGAAAMLAPALHALEARDFHVARVFLYGAVLVGGLTLLVGLSVRGRQPQNWARSSLLTLFAAYGLLPALLALPFIAALPGVSLREGWFEMVSSMTTTGATLWDDPMQLPPSLHLWRGIVAWLGGYLSWVAALAILAPLNLGGYEIAAAGGPAVTPRAETAAARRRLNHLARELAIVYAGLTALLWGGLMLAGDPGLVAAIHAMSVISTSGVSPVGGLQWAQSGFAGEAMILMFFVFGLSRRTFDGMGRRAERPALWRDPELRLAALIVIAATAATLAAQSLHAGAADAAHLAAGLWGNLFTFASFLSTTGFESRAWFGSVVWSRLETPGLILLGLALIGGGVATTAGGVKLFRLYALIRHGQREVERLVQPNSIGGAGAEARRIRRSGAGIAWVYFMLFTLAILAVMAGLSLTGLQFETALVLTVSAITTTGTLAQVAAQYPISYDGLPALAQTILAAAMVLGRLEILALLALFNADFWRR